MLHKRKFPKLKKKSTTDLEIDRYGNPIISRTSSTATTIVVCIALILLALIVLFFIKRYWKRIVKFFKKRRKPKHKFPPKKYRKFDTRPEIKRVHDPEQHPDFGERKPDYWDPDEDYDDDDWDDWDDSDYWDALEAQMAAESEEDRKKKKEPREDKFRQSLRRAIQAKSKARHQKPNVNLQTRFMQESHSYDNVIRAKPIAVTHEPSHKHKRKPIHYAEVIVKNEKQKNYNTPFNPKSKHPYHNKTQEKIKSDWKIKPKERRGEVVNKKEHLNRKSSKPLNNQKLRYHTSSSELESESPVQRNSKKRSEFKKLIPQVKKIRDKLTGKPTSDETGSEVEKLTNLLKKMLKKSKFCMESKENMLSQRTLHSIRAEYKGLNEKKVKQTETVTSNQPNIPNLIQGNRSEYEQSNDTKPKTTAIALEAPDLPEVIDSKSFLADLTSREVTELRKYTRY